MLHSRISWPCLGVSCVLASLLSTGCRGDAQRSNGLLDSGIPDIALPPVVDANYGAGDSIAAQNQRRFACGTLSGGISGKLYCDRVYPDFTWDVYSGSGLLFIQAYFGSTDGATSSGQTGASSFISFEFLTPGKMSRLTETCATLPQALPHALKPSYTASIEVGTATPWSAACASATEVLPGTSFELIITSVGVLTTDSAGADPLDASPDALNWSTLNREVLSNSFHGSLKATLPATNGGMPVQAELTF